MVVNCTSKQTDMDVIKFINHLNNIVNKVSKEQKQIFLLGNFNVNLLNDNVYQPTKGL